MKEINKRQPILSIIIPVYNAQSFLERCLQFFADKDDWYEVILIDDGSEDDSLKICQRYQRQWRHLHVVHQENSGVSVARNVGIENATGKWICFVDSDDYITNDWKQTIMQALNNDKNADVLIFSNSIEEKQYFGEDCAKASLGFYNVLGENGSTLSWCVSKLYLRSLITSNNIKFIPQMINGEDMLFNCSVFSKAKKIIGVNKGYYCYYKNMQSATNRFNSKIVDTEILFHKNLKNIVDSNCYESDEWRTIYDISLLTGLFAILYRIGLSKEKGNKTVLVEFLSMDEYVNVLKKLSCYKTFLPLIKKVPLCLLRYRLVELAIAYARLFCFLKSVYYKKNSDGVVETI